MVFSFHITTFYSVFICPWGLLQRHLLSNTRIKIMLYLVLLPTCWHELWGDSRAAECFHVATCNFRGAQRAARVAALFEGNHNHRRNGEGKHGWSRNQSRSEVITPWKHQCFNYGWQRSYTMRFQLGDKALKLLFILWKQDLELQSYRQP